MTNDLELQALVRSFRSRQRRAVERTHVVYRCFDADGALLYIGQTGDLRHRMRGHKSESPWWPSVIEVTATRPTTRFAAHRYERLAIRAERPRHNILGTDARAWPHPRPGRLRVHDWESLNATERAALLRFDRRGHHHRQD